MWLYAALDLLLSSVVSITSLLNGCVSGIDVYSWSDNSINSCSYDCLRDNIR